MTLGYLQLIGRFKPVFWRSALGLLAGVIILASPTGAVAQPDWADDLDRDSLRTAIRRSISYLDKLPRERVVGEQPRRLSAGQVLDSLRAFERLLERWDCRPCFQKELQSRFELVPSSNDTELEQVLFTGYYQPILEASLTRTEEYRYPLYGTPADLVMAERVTLTPEVRIERVIGRADDVSFPAYYSRREIDEAGALLGRGIELAWAKDPVDIFFLQIQGSGVLQLPDGRRIHIGYAAQNGQPYRSIGRLLIDQEKIPKEEMSMQRLRRYLAENPAERDEILYYNESYVFFRLLEDGPFGSLGVTLTPGRSLATDSRLFPKGALAFVATEQPVVGADGEVRSWEPLSRFMLNQDTGGAIRGLQRGDIYFGGGAAAGAQAGYMNRQGKLFFLVLKDKAAAVKR
ncbi:MAG: transglycosylase [Deltaproteobacteria bacterium]|nr:transglycosylase [Deltaproteobacteria bacterium]MBM4299246.1 transglycosylase [Deltaproteobacteria bacterium]